MSKKNKIWNEIFCNSCPNNELREKFSDGLRSKSSIVSQGLSVAVEMMTESTCPKPEVSIEHVKTGKYGKSQVRREVNCGHPAANYAGLILESVLDYSEDIEH